MKLSGGPDFVPKRTQVPADNSTAMIETFVIQSMPALQRPFLQEAFATLSCQAAQPLILLRMSKLFANQTSAWCNVQVSGLYANLRVWQLYNFQILNSASKVDSQQDSNHPNWVCKSYNCILGYVWVRPVQGRRPDWSGVAFRQRVYGPGTEGVRPRDRHRVSGLLLRYVSCCSDQIWPHAQCNSVVFRSYFCLNMMECAGWIAIFL